MHPRFICSSAFGARLREAGRVFVSLRENNFFVCLGICKTITSSTKMECVRYNRKVCIEQRL